jgi:hypothetical protein
MIKKLTRQAAWSTCRSFHGAFTERGLILGLAALVVTSSFA